MTHLLSVDDFSDEDIDAVIHLANRIAGGDVPRSAPRQLGMLFMEPSLRTRTGFMAAAHRLGWPTPIEVSERRAGLESQPESVADTVSVLSAYCDTLVARVGEPIASVAEHVPGGCTAVNAGDRGDVAEHPTQALIDLFAMETLVGPIAELSVALVGDLRMRSARSLLKLLARRPPRELVLVTDPVVMDGFACPDALSRSTITDGYDGIGDVDAIHAIGLPTQVRDESVRERLRVDAGVLGRLSGRGRVFSPMPVIDEVDRAVRSDGRLAFHQQSAQALFVRMAVLGEFVAR